MNYDQATDKLKRIANGKTYSVGYSELHYRSGAIGVECSLYVQDYDIASGPTYEKAFTALRKIMHPEIVKRDPKQVPNNRRVHAKIS